MKGLAEDLLGYTCEDLVQWLVAQGTVPFPDSIRSGWPDR